MDDADYFAARERAERALADEASSAEVREIHLVLAEKYAALTVREVGRPEYENDFSAQSADAG